VTARKVKADAIRAGDRRALARAITLIESTRAADRAEAEALLTSLLPHTGKSMRLGISGAPGAGKSTFIEAFGGLLTGTGKRVAVLAVDPSSQRSGGSILGDKTRMERLARDPNAFIRPSPAGVTLGGVARRTHETVLLVEAAGYDVVLVETVGVGQSETAVAGMVDLFVLLVSPGGGDDLQGIKRGVMELADLVVVTKADGDLVKVAARAVSDYQAAMHLMRPKFSGVFPEVMKVSALESVGIREVRTALDQLHQKLTAEGVIELLRDGQARRWFWSEIEAVLADMIRSDPKATKQARLVEADVVAGRALPHAAARLLAASVLGRLDGADSAP
jgi:LAO/AO transport system kinase